MIRELYVNTIRIWWLLEDYEGSGTRLVLYFACFAYLFICNKEFRKRLGIPMLVLFAVVFNPVTFKLIWQFMGYPYWYWRMFWMLGEVIIIGYAIVDIICRIRFKPGKILAVIVSAGLLVWSGAFVYTQNVFAEADNFMKLPQNAIEIADALLEMDENPKALVPRKIYGYIRQYSNDIELLYGRNADGYTQSIEGTEAYEVSVMIREQNIDYAFMTDVCRKNGVEFIVLRKANAKDLSEYGYEYVKDVNKYSIYRMK